MKTKHIQHRSTCPISTALDIIGDKWSLLIVRDMVFNAMNSYGEFMNGGEHIATNILADRLALLEAGGIISKQKHPLNKTKYLYALTPKGIDLVPLLAEMIIWSERYHDVHPYAKNFVAALQQDKAGTIDSIVARLKSA